MSGTIPLNHVYICEPNESDIGSVNDTSTLGTKYDGDKPMMALLPMRALTEVAKGMTYGAKKYGQHNYLGGITYIRLLSACLRHVTAYVAGHDLDDESGIAHWAHACCCLLMLGEMTFLKPELDDRHKP